MRATIKNYIDAAKRRREEEGEEGFSLIELIIVVVILGILVAIAIPVFANIQSASQDNALKAAAANGATAVAAAISDSDTATTGTTAVTKINAGSKEIGLTTAATDPTTVDGVCVTAQSGEYKKQVSAGPGCTAANAYDVTAFSGTTP
ncbi:type II secretion system protein [Microbacterium trichothecenolyticum]